MNDKQSTPEGLLADLKKIGEFLPHEPDDTETSEWHYWLELDEAYSRIATALELLPSERVDIVQVLPLPPQPETVTTATPSTGTTYKIPGPWAPQPALDTEEKIEAYLRNIPDKELLPGSAERIAEFMGRINKLLDVTLPRTLADDLHVAVHGLCSAYELEIADLQGDIRRAMANHNDDLNAAPELRAGSAALKTCATSAADESSPHGTAHHFSPDKQETPRTDALLAEHNKQFIKSGFARGNQAKQWDEFIDFTRQLERELAEARDADFLEAAHKWQERAEKAEAALSARTPIADLSAFMVTHDVDVDFCYPGNHGGPVDEWLVTLTNQSANRVEEFVGRTLDEAITYAVTQYVGEKG